MDDPRDRIAKINFSNVFPFADIPWHLNQNLQPHLGQAATASETGFKNFINFWIPAVAGMT
jgi:hypothetical protein